MFLEMGALSRSDFLACSQASSTEKNFEMTCVSQVRSQCDYCVNHCPSGILKDGFWDTAGDSQCEHLFK